jgi:hypothetical protein
MRTGTEHLPPQGEQRPHPERTGAVTTIATLLPVQAPGRLTHKARRYLRQIIRFRFHPSLFPSPLQFDSPALHWSLAPGV